MSTTPMWREKLNASYVKFASLNPERAKTELAFALQTFQTNPRLQSCDGQSILDAIVNIARTNLSLNPITKLAYLIPRKNKCVLEISYVGLVKMLKDDGCIKHISAHIVYEDEFFNYDVPNNKITHNATYPKTEAEHKSREIKGVYTRAELPSGDVIFDFLPTWEIEKIKGVSSFNGKGSVWDTWKLEMYKKTAIKRSFKLLIGNASNNLASVLALEEENNPIKNINNSNKPRLKTAFIEESDEENPFTAFDDIEVGRLESAKKKVEETLKKADEIIEVVKQSKENKSTPENSIEQNHQTHNIKVNGVEITEDEMNAELEKVAEKTKQEFTNENTDLFGDK
jgi:recombination protein RecT